MSDVVEIFDMFIKVLATVEKTLRYNFLIVRRKSLDHWSKGH